MLRKTAPRTLFKTHAISRLRNFAWLVAAIVLFSGAIWLIVQLDPPADGLSGTARASDGDTLRLPGERIRLLGIDAPELAQTCWRKDGEEWPCGKAAHNRLALLIRDKVVTCEGDQRDRYGRLLATCAVSGKDLGAVMVGEGLAVGDWDYKAAELKARTAGRGIWSGRFDQPRQWRDAHDTQPSEWNIFEWVESWF
jgi:endonuclease YncB( thermonuclease family)